MKAFKAYLTESAKTFDFRLRIAGELPNDMLNKIKGVLEAYKVEKVSATKRLPIQETPEFPNMGPVEVNIIDVCLCYPCNDEQVRTLIAERAGLSLACIKVTPSNSPYEAIMDGTEVSNLGGKPGEAVLLQDNMERERPGKDGDALVGDARIPDLIKELEETRKYTYPDVAGGKETNKSFMSQGTTNQLPQGNASPVGTHKNKIINPRSMKAGNGK
jgi:hypothetical protein